MRAMAVPSCHAVIAIHMKTMQARKGDDQEGFHLKPHSLQHAQHQKHFTKFHKTARNLNRHQVKLGLVRGKVERSFQDNSR